MRLLRLGSRLSGRANSVAQSATSPLDAGLVVEARSLRARRPRSLRSTRPSSAAAANRAARSKASSSSGPITAASCPMSRRMVPSVREAIKGSEMPSIQTRVRRPSPRSSPVIRSRAKMRSARANLPKPKATIRVSDATPTSWHPAATQTSLFGRLAEGSWALRTHQCSSPLLVHGHPCHSPPGDHPAWPRGKPLTAEDLEPLTPWGTGERPRSSDPTSPRTARRPGRSRQ